MIRKFFIVHSQYHCIVFSIRQAVQYAVILDGLFYQLVEPAI